jgi:predicted ATP-dependent endonuclease of OLD family
LLLVEGDTEKLALPEFFRRLDYDLDRLGVTIVEVGGKKNLIEFLEIAKSFDIPTGVVFDADSSDFKDEGEEAAFNKGLLDRDRSDGSFRVWMMSKNYEDAMKEAAGEKLYQLKCQKYPGLSKAVRARQMAADPEVPIPSFMNDIVGWLRSE